MPKTILDIEKEFDKSFGIVAPYELNTDAKLSEFLDELKSFIRTVIPAVFEATRGEEKKEIFHYDNEVLREVYFSKIESYNNCLAEQREREDKFMGGVN